MPGTFALLPHSTHSEIPAVSDPAIRSWIVEWGEDHAVHRSLVSVTDAHGKVNWRTNEFTRVGNALHYLDHGVWKPSQDKIELQRDGTAAALHGPHKAFFDPDLRAETVFSVQMADGRRFSGGVRGLRITETTAGESQWVGWVRAQVRGELLAPNQILYRDAFDGVAADVVYEWRRDRFAQDIVLRQRPILPEGWDPARVRLEVVTEFRTERPPLVQYQSHVEPDGSSIEDATLIDLGRMSLVLGHAFPVSSGAGCRFGEPLDRDGTVPVQKRWTKSVKGWHILIESLRWDVAEPHLGKLPPAVSPPAAVPGGDSLDSLSGLRRHVEARARETRRSTLQWAQADRSPYPSTDGYVIDFLVIPQNRIKTFRNGFTYYIQSSYYLSTPVTFHDRTVIKFRHGTHLRMFGPMTFPPTQPHAVFTSRNDDLFGEWIGGIPGEVNSDGDPTQHRASEAIFVYYQHSANVVQNARVRWAQTAVRYLGTAQQVSHTLRDCLLEQSDVGVRASVPASSPVTLINVQKSVVATSTSGGYVGGVMPELILNASNEAHYQAEPAIAVRQQTAGDTVNTKVVIVALSRRYPPPAVADIGMLRMISSDGGKTWPLVGYVATGGADDLPLADGDADPSLVYDDFGNLFLAYRGTGPGNGLICAISEDDGVTFTKVRGFDEVMAGLPGFAGGTPRLAVGRRADGEYGSLWITLSASAGGELRCATTDIRGFGAGNVGGPRAWVTSAPLTVRAKWSSIAVGPSGSVMLVYTQGAGISAGDAPVTYHTMRCPGYPSASFQPIPTATFTLANMGEFFLPGTGVDTVPVLAWDRGGGRDLLYLCYTTRAVGAPSAATDAVVRVYDGHGHSWRPEVKVHGDYPASRLQPWVSVDESTGYVAVIWFENDPSLGQDKFYPYATFSADGFASGVTRGQFRLSARPADTGLAGMDLKEYIGLRCFQGAFYPAFPNNGTGPSTAWDIFSGRVPF